MGLTDGELVVNSWLARGRPEVLLMSPPCQPHTRQGDRKDEGDTRSQPLAHIGTVSIITVLKGQFHDIFKYLFGLNLLKLQEAPAFF
jgi:site-specific DNA-cytosine methylase